MGYREHHVDGSLGQWVECAWTRRGSDSHDRIVPDGCMDLIWSASGGLSAVGPNTTAFLAPLRPGDEIVGVRLHPGAAPSLFGVPGPALRDARVPAGRLWGDEAKRFEERVASAETPAERVRLLVAFLASRAGAAPDPVVREAARRLARTSVAGVAEELAVSERHLRRLVTDNVGYGPKLLARVSAGSELAEVAYDEGYADQAHFSHDCRELAGVPPGRFLQDRAA